MQLTSSDVAAEIEAFVNGSGGPWDWDDFISIPIKDTKLDQIRQRCGRLPDEFPPTEAGQYCGAEGLAVLRSILSDLRGGSA
jgi:hypothetical protein